jgi:hypothetical protein
LALTENERNTLQNVVNRLKRNSTKSKDFMESIEDEKLCQTDLFQKYWISNLSNENLIDLLEITFDLEKDC